MKERGGIVHQCLAQSGASSVVSKLLPVFPLGGWWEEGGGDQHRFGEINKQNKYTPE